MALDGGCGYSEISDLDPDRRLSILWKLWIGVKMAARSSMNSFCRM
jgi:hypothetical protein